MQRGEQPDDFKPMPAVGKGVEEIRVTDESGAYRVIYVASCGGCLRVARLPKKTQATSRRDIEIAGNDLRNCREVENEETRELRQRLGRNCGHDGTGG